MYVYFLLRLWANRVGLYIVLGSLVMGAFYWSLQAFARGPLGDDTVSANAIVNGLVALFWGAFQVGSMIIAFVAVKAAKRDSQAAATSLVIVHNRRLVGGFVGCLVGMSIVAIVLGETLRPEFSCNSSDSKIVMVRGELIRRTIEKFNDTHGRYHVTLLEAGIDDKDSLNLIAVRWEYWTEDNNTQFVLQFGENRGSGKCKFVSRCNCWRSLGRQYERATLPVVGS